MPARPARTSPWALAGEGRLRGAVLRLGSLLGWSADDVAGFAASLTGRAWTDCGPDELGRVLEEYERLAEAVVARAAGSRRARGKGVSRAARE